MGKNKGFDVIADAHELANHNFHASYWFNRVTSYTVAQWKTNKYFAPLLFVLCTTTGVIALNSLNQISLRENKTFWSVLFDFSDSSTTAQFTSILMLLFLWVVAGIGTVQNILQRIHTPPPTPQPEGKRKKKKKYPKRPKNYK